MAKLGGFHGDLIAMQAEMKTVARVIEASRVQTTAKKIQAPAPTTVDPDSPELNTPLPSSRRVAKAVTARKPLPPTPQARENVTTRLASETNELLTAAALRQKLKGNRPDTRQDIIEEAVSEWLRRHGYDRRKKELADATDESIESDNQPPATAGIRSGNPDVMADCAAQFPLETLHNSKPDND